MPNQKTHTFVGIAAGTAASLYCTRNHTSASKLLQAIGASIGGYCGGRLPDIIEPALNPRHRAAAHSLTVGAAIVTTGVKGAQIITDKAEAAANNLFKTAEGTEAPIGKLLLGALGVSVLIGSGFVVGVSSGYASHVALDSITPASLPLI